MGLWRPSRLQHCETLWLFGTDFGFTKLSHLSANIVKFEIQKLTTIKIRKTIRSPGNKRLVHLTSTSQRNLGQVFVKTYMRFRWVVRRNVPQG